MTERDIYTDEEEAAGMAYGLRRMHDMFCSHWGEKIRIADLGCGKGTVLRHVHTHFPQAALFGIDLDPRVVTMAQAAVPEAQISKGSFIETPWQDNAFELVISNLVHDYSEEGILRATYRLNDFVREVKRILVPGGSYIPLAGDASMTAFGDERLQRLFTSGGLIGPKDPSSFLIFSKPQVG